MATRKIIQIDEDKCTGCGQCVPSCAEGAIQIIDGKARLVGDTYCDGLGACLGDCPEDALHIIEREADEFDEEAVKELLAKQQNEPKKVEDIPMMSGCPGSASRSLPTGGGCPGSQARSMAPATAANDDEATPSQLGNWPVQLHLLSPMAPYLQGAELLIAADCVPFAYADFHQKLLRGRPVAIGCPKLDDTQAYVEKLTVILRDCGIKSLTVAHMEVPCCMGIVSVAETALRQSGVDIPFKTVCIGINGEVQD